MAAAQAATQQAAIMMAVTEDQAEGLPTRAQDQQPVMADPTAATEEIATLDLRAKKERAAKGKERQPASLAKQPAHCMRAAEQEKITVPGRVAAAAKAAAQANS